MAAEYTLNIYGENDEIVKTYETNIIRWRMFTKAVELQDKIKSESEEEQIKAIAKFVCSIFPGLTIEETEDADAFDLMNTFNQIINKAKMIKGVKNTDKKDENNPAKN